MKRKHTLCYFCSVLQYYTSANISLFKSCHFKIQVIPFYNDISVVLVVIENYENPLFHPGCTSNYMKYSNNSSLWRLYELIYWLWQRIILHQRQQYVKYQYWILWRLFKEKQILWTLTLLLAKQYKASNMSDFYIFYIDKIINITFRIDQIINVIRWKQPIFMVNKFEIVHCLIGILTMTL